MLISNRDIKISTNKDISNPEIYSKKSPVTPSQSGRSHGAAHLMKRSDKPIKREIT